MRRFAKSILLGCLVVAAVGCLATVAQACPMCNQSIAEEEDLPRAFMYSILFMLGMPATILGGFGTMLFIKFRQHNASQTIGVAGDDLVTIKSRNPAAPA